MMLLLERGGLRDNDVVFLVGFMTGAEVVMAGHRGGMTTAAWGLKRILN